MKQLLLSGLLILNVPMAWAQNEVSLIQTRDKMGISQEFNVLNADKTVRHGSYVKYRLISGPQNVIALLETGNYERGHKEGEWRTFVMSPYNKLESKGSYHAGLPEGQWFYYHQPKPGVLGRAMMAGKKHAESLSFDSEDSTAVVRAKGMCSEGKRVGLWKYYDVNSKLIQAINESTNQLMYWEQPSGQSVSGEIVSANHPLLYVGGKDLMLHELYTSISAASLLQTSGDYLTAGQTINSEVIISVDALGTQTKLSLSDDKVPSKYEQFLLMQIGRQNLRWLPKIEHGKPLSAEYRLLIVTQKFTDKNVKLVITPFGE